VGAKGSRPHALSAVIAAMFLVSSCADSPNSEPTETSSTEGVDVSENMENAQVAQSAGDVESAVDEYDAVIESDPDNRVALFNLGLLRRAQGDFSGSIEAWTELIAANPDMTVARYQRAITFRASGDFEAAIADLRIVVDEEPSNKDALNQLGTLLIALGEEEEGQMFLNRVFETATTSPNN
jgi:tetratricopeptide (TPR) repeat protein